MKWWRRNRCLSAALAASVFAFVAAGTLAVAPAPVGASPGAITLTIDTTASGCTGTTVYLPLSSANGLSLDATIDFGDSSSPVTDTASGVHPYTYSSPGSYTITITGVVPQFGTGNLGTTIPDCSLTAVTNWDGVNLTSLDGGFDGDSNLLSVPTDLPSTVIDLANTFGFTTFNQDLESWDTSNVVTMDGMFQDDPTYTNAGDPLATTFDGWNTSHVSDFGSMFEDSSFNQDVSSWNTADATTMSAMFDDDTVFNNGGSQLPSSTGGWDTSNVTDLSQMFEFTDFNQAIESWNTANVTDMNAMFEEDNEFANGGDPLGTTGGGWNTANVTNMNSIFYNDFAININVDGWNTANVTDMSFMFFDDPIFNNGGSPLPTHTGGWNTANVTSMDSMFTFDTVFNQDLSSWDTSKVTDMYYLFFKAGAFDQDLGQWSLASATNVNDMLDDTLLSTANYDATLTGWASQTVIPNLTLSAADLTYDMFGAPGRATLTSSPDDWTIQNDSEVAPFEPQATLTLAAVAPTPVGQPITLSTAGGSGTGSVSFSVTGGTASGCVISGDVLTSTGPGTCIVTAAKTADATFAQATSSPRTFTFHVIVTTPAPTQQATLTLTVVAPTTVGQPITLSTAGGSGTGSVSFSVTGGTASGCAISGDVLTSTGPGTCIVTAAKVADATYATSTSAPATITFLASPPLPGRLTLGFAHRSDVLGAGARRAVGTLSRRLTSADVVTVTAYSLHNASLARHRATAVVGLLRTSPARVRIVIITRLASNKCVVVTRA